MEKSRLEEITNAMQTKLGNDQGLIADDIANLISENESENEKNREKDEEIRKLKEKNESLTKVNGNLLKQVSMGYDETKIQNQEEDKKKIISKKDIFDEKGNFIE